MQTHQSQSPFFIPIKRKHLTEEELNAPVGVVTIRVWGDYTCRGEHRKEVITREYDAELEVPDNFNKGHIKLAANRHVKNVLKGIRARHCYHDEASAPKPQPHKRRVRDFMSWQGIRDNETMKREYEREIEKRKAEAENMQNGILPSGAVDDSVYGSDGLPKFSEKTYLAR